MLRCETSRALRSMTSALADRIEREVANVVAQVAPGVEVPVLAVIHEALWRDFALGSLAAAAGKVGDGQALAPQQRRADFLEMGQLEFAFTEADDQHAAADLLGGVVGAAEQAGEPREQGLDLGGRAGRQCRGSVSRCCMVSRAWTSPELNHRPGSSYWAPASACGLLEAVAAGGCPASRSQTMGALSRLRMYSRSRLSVARETSSASSNSAESSPACDRGSAGRSCRSAQCDP
jgi:hypothetical protein